MTFKSSTNLQELHLSLCVVRVATKGCQNARNKIFCDRKTFGRHLVFSTRSKNRGRAGYEELLREPKTETLISQSDYKKKYS